MNLWAQKLRSSRGNCNDVWSIYSTRAQLLSVFLLMAAVLCIACGADILAQNSELILVLVKKEHSNPLNVCYNYFLANRLVFQNVVT